MMSVYRPPLVLTARMDAESQEYFDGLRVAHFPVERNYLRAHVTLFHALPGDRVAEVCAVVAEAASGCEGMEGRVVRVRSLGRGVAYDVECPGLGALRRSLQGRLAEAMELTRQDLQGGSSKSWRGHITVQNKVEPEVARALLAELSAAFVERRIGFTGLTLWEYLSGPWKLVREVEFGRGSS